MTEAHAGPHGGPAAWLDDWITIWHSEIAAAITDPELHETLLHLVDLWATEARRIASTSLDLVAGTLPSPRPPAAAAAPDGRDAVIAGLLARVAELERRLDGRSA